MRTLWLAALMLLAPNITWKASGVGPDITLASTTAGVDAYRWTLRHGSDSTLIGIDSVIHFHFPIGKDTFRLAVRDVATKHWYYRTGYLTVVPAVVAKVDTVKIKLPPDTVRLPGRVDTVKIVNTLPGRVDTVRLSTSAPVAFFNWDAIGWVGKFVADSISTPSRVRFYWVTRLGWGDRQPDGKLLVAQGQTGTPKGRMSVDSARVILSPASVSVVGPSKVSAP